MNWFTNLFKTESAEKSETEKKYLREYFEGCDAFMIGEKLWKDSVSSEGSLEFRKSKRSEALKFFDLAIEKGYDDAEVFSLRGSCLNDLEFYFDAIEDYNKAIQNNPKKGIADNFFCRSMIKESIFDFEGSLADIKEAIRLSKLDNDDSKYWNDYAKSTGFNSATAFYELHLYDVKMRIDVEKRHPTDINSKLKTIKRREL